MTNSPDKKPKTLTGQVVSDKSAKTITVRVARMVKHKLYGKFIRKSKKYQVHDQDNRFKVGDKVMIQETKPISKNKTWKVAESLEQADIAK